MPCSLQGSYNIKTKKWIFSETGAVMIFVLTFLNFAFGTHSNGICLDSRHLVLGLRVQSTSVGESEKEMLPEAKVLKESI